MRRSPQFIVASAAAVIALLSASCGTAPSEEEAGAPSTTTTQAPTTTTTQPPPPTTRPSTTTTEAPTTSTTQPPPPTTQLPPTTTEAPTTSTTRPPPPTTQPPPPEPVAPEPALLRQGDQGPEVSAVQVRLEELRYWVGPTDGVYGELTRQAVIAFQKVEGLTVDGIVGPEVRAALPGASATVPVGGPGDRLEVDKTRQVLLAVDDGATLWTFNTSTGTDREYQHPDGYTAVADTPSGTWDIEWQVDGTDPGPLGPLYRPKYFHSDGLAVHGYDDVPTYPASHGCVRVTDPAMDWIWASGLAPVGGTVLVHGAPPTPTGPAV